MDTLATFSLADHACTVAVDSLWSNAGDGAQQPSVYSPKMLVQLHLSTASGGFLQTCASHARSQFRTALPPGLTERLGYPWCRTRCSALYAQYDNVRDSWWQARSSSHDLVTRGERGVVHCAQRCLWGLSGMNLQLSPEKAECMA